MKSFKGNHIKLKKALITAYHEKEKAEVGELWQMKVMSHIRSLGPLTSKTNYFELLEQFVWRFAPVACLLILILAICIIKLDPISDYEMARAFIDDPVDFTLLQLFEG